MFIMNFNKLGTLDGKVFTLENFKWAFANDYGMFLDMKEQNPDLKHGTFDLLWCYTDKKVKFERGGEVNA
jgi:hypothetical protein